MFKNLNAGAVGIHGLDLAQTIELAQKIGFGGIDFSIQEAAQLADAHGVEYVRKLFDEAGVKPGQWGLPVAWNKDEAEWKEGLAALPRLAALGLALGCTRTATWCLSGSNERPFEENWQWHIGRFRPIAEILAAHGCVLGIEFLGPQTIRDRFEHEFVYTLGGMMALAREIGGNVGLLLDAWHLFTSGDGLDVLDEIAARDVVTVHVNDAPEGLTLESYVDSDRRLPMETGVIDLPGLINKLAAMGYDGPVTPEPFSKRINELAAQDAMAAGELIADYMARLWKAAGLE